MRIFKTGATRNDDTDRLDYEAFLSPLVLERYAQYLHKHRVQRDGTLREGDNWQAGIPLPAYAKSLLRHTISFWKAHRGYEAEDIEESLSAIIFNASGYLFELLKNEKR